MKLLKKYLLDILVVIVFAVISFVYFMPADMDGRILFRLGGEQGIGTRERAFPTADWRDNPLDQLCVWWYANLSDVAFVRQYPGAQPGNEGLSSVVA